MQKRQTVLGSYHRWHLLTSSIFAAVMVSLLSACGTSNTGGRSTRTPTATQTPTQTLAHLTVYDTADSGMLRALKADTGQLRWQGQTGQLAGGQPVVENGIVYAGSSHTVYAFKASDGTLLWSAQGYNPATGPLVADGKVFVDSYTNESDGSVTISVVALKAAVLSALGTDTRPAQFLLYAFRANDGTLLWRSSGTFTQGSRATLLVENEVVFAYVDRLSAYQVSDGKLLWQSQGASQPLSGPNGTYSDLLVTQGSVYAATIDGLTAYRIENGSQLWHIATESGLDQFLEIKLLDFSLH